MGIDPLLFSITQIRLHSWLLTLEDPWLLEWWVGLDVLDLKESRELLALLDIQVPVDHQDTEACQESLVTLVPEV